MADCTQLQQEVSLLGNLVVADSPGPREINVAFFDCLVAECTRFAAPLATLCVPVSSFAESQDSKQEKLENDAIN